MSQIAATIVLYFRRDARKTVVWGSGQKVGWGLVVEGNEGPYNENEIERTQMDAIIHGVLSRFQPNVFLLD